MRKLEPASKVAEPIRRQAFSAEVAPRSAPSGPLVALRGRLGNAGLSRVLTHMVQRERVPDSAGLGNALPPAADTVGVMNARTGLARALSRSWANLDAAKQTKVQTDAAAFGIKFKDEASLLVALNSASRDQLVKFADAVRTADPTKTLGDPALIDVGARNAADQANIDKVVANADKVYTTIASGANDTDIEQVFGKANVATAKGKYAKGAARMKALNTAKKIVTDRSGYNAEVFLGGLSNSQQISVEPDVIDKPDDKGSVATMVHESMHAGNDPDVTDLGYINSPSFKVLPEATKLNNAAHYEVVARRILVTTFSFPGETFIPAGTSVGSVSVPALTPRQQAIRDASETFRGAWTAGLNLHTVWVRVFKKPTEWDTLDVGTAFKDADAGAHFSDCLPFWSKVEGLTTHLRTAAINPSGGAAVHPVTLIDISLSEGLTRKLGLGMDMIPEKEADALAFETANASAAERAAATTVAAERDLLILLVLRAKLGSLTGDEKRDLRVITQLAKGNAASNFAEYLKKRPPSAFP